MDGWDYLSGWLGWVGKANMLRIDWEEGSLTTFWAKVSFFFFSRQKSREGTDMIPGFFFHLLHLLVLAFFFFWGVFFF